MAGAKKAEPGTLQATVQAAGKSVSKQARANARNAKVAQEAGGQGKVLSAVPTYPIRADLVDPVLSFVVYGVPSPQGSKEFGGFRNGKPVLTEQSKGVDPWRKTVRHVALQAIRDWSAKTGRTWAAIDEPVMVSAVVTLPSSKAAETRGDVFSYSVPDLDKLQRAIGDALAPTPLRDSDGKGMTERARKQVREKMMSDRRKQSVLHDDSRIVIWDQCMKVYPGTMPMALGYPGVVIRIWRMSELHRVSKTPVVKRDGHYVIKAGDLRKWATPASGSWESAVAEAWRDPQRVLSAPLDRPISVRGKRIDQDGVCILLKALATESPERFLTLAVSAEDPAVGTR